MFIIFFICVIIRFIVEVFILKTDYLWKYKIESDACRFATKSIERDNDHYQLIKADDFYFYIDKKSDVVVRFKHFLDNSSSVSVVVMKKNKKVCSYLHFMDSIFKLSQNYLELLEKIVMLAQTSFYFLIEGKNRDDVIDFLNENEDCSLSVRTVNSLVHDISSYLFLSMSVRCFYNIHVTNNRLDFDACLLTLADGRLMIDVTDTTSKSAIVEKLLKRYSIKKIKHYESFNKDLHYYTITLNHVRFAEISVLYNTKKNKTTFTLLTLCKGEPVLKKRHIMIEHNANFEINILKKIEELYLKQYPSEDLIKYFADSYMDVSNGLKKEHLTVLKMFDI